MTELYWNVSKENPRSTLTDG